MNKRLLVCWMILIFVFCNWFNLDNYHISYAKESDLNIESPAAILIELQSGKILYEKDCDKALKPASVTKLMTMYLTFESLKKGEISLEDEVVISEHAASMGGSQVYLEEGEKQTVNDLLKCMIVSSANDAAVALAEHIAGSEEDFVEKMNQKAKELQMNSTHFVNPCGLEASEHYLSPKAIAILSRRLLLDYPEVLDYTTIWIDKIVHKTRKGESDFGLASTNKFLKKYEGANGLKTGYTSDAGFSISASATRDGMTLIAVVMGADTKEMREKDVEALLDYGFSNCKCYEDKKVLNGKNCVEIPDGNHKTIRIKAKNNFSYAFIGNYNTDKISKTLKFNKHLPIKEGEKIGTMDYYYNDKIIGSVDLISIDSVKEDCYWDIFLNLLYELTKTNYIK